MTLSPLIAAGPFIQIHVVAAIAAVLIGALVLFRRKGTRLHRTLGRVWVALMLVVALSSFLITEMRLIGPFGPIHALSLFTLYSLFQGVRAIRAGQVERHRMEMQTLYMVGLITAGAFTFLPGRRMHEMLFGAEAGWGPALAVLALAAGFILVLALRIRRRRDGIAAL